MPELDAGILVDQTGLEVRHKEDVGNGQNAEEDTKDNANGGTDTKLLQGRCSGRFNDNKQSQDSGCGGDVEGNETHGPLERILALKHGVLDGCEYNCGEGCGDHRSDCPRCSNLRHRARLPPPGDCGLRRKADTDKSTHDGLGGRHRETEPSCKHKPASTSDFGAAHDEHEHARSVIVAVDRDDSVLDGVGDTVSEGYCTDEFRYEGQETNLRPSKC